MLASIPHNCVKLLTIVNVKLSLYNWLQMAVSMYCRLGFARKKGADNSEEDLHPTWAKVKGPTKK